MSDWEPFVDLIIGTLVIMMGMCFIFLIVSLPLVWVPGIVFIGLGGWRFGRAVKAAWFE
jgi:hypothetical protein